MMPEWYAPKDIIFNMKQVRWLLSWLFLMIGGEWPEEPYESGYTDIPSVQRSRSQGAPFETSCQIAGELEARIKRTGQDGEMLRAHYCDGWELDRIARLAGLNEHEVVKRIHRASTYIASGPNRRWHDTPSRQAKTYQDWISHRRTPRKSAVSLNCAT